MPDFTLYLPIAGIEINGLKLILLGFTVGVIGGFFGVGGAFIVTPALNVFGFPMAYAIGTDMAHIAGSSIISSVRHRRLGNVDIRLGLLMIAGTVAGIELGSLLVMHLEKAGNIGPVLRLTYVALLFSLGSFMAVEYSGHRKGHDHTKSFLRKIHDIKIHPMIHLRVSGISISLWVVLAVAVITGFIAGMLGVGGGFIRMPALMYVIGASAKVAVGTDLFEVMISGMYGTFTYALKGRVDIFAAMVMLGGAAFGAPLGSLSTKYVRGAVIKLYFAAAMIVSGVSIIFRHMAEKAMDVYIGQLTGWAKEISGLTDKTAVSQWLHTNKAMVMTWLSGQPDAIQNAYAMERTWNSLSGYLMLGAACSLSAVIILLLVMGIIAEKKIIKT